MLINISMDWINKVLEIFQRVPQIVVVFCVVILGLYVFWRGCAQSRKNRSSVFDIFLFSGFFAVLIGRVVHIILEWETYSTFIWYWLPYEKYGDKVYLFRLLPWRFVSIWDGGIVIFAAFLSVILSMTFFSLIIKKWRWKDMFFPIYYSAITMLGSSLVCVGLKTGNRDWIYKGSVLMVILLLFSLFSKFIYKIVKNPAIEKYVLGYVGVGIVLLSSVYISYMYFSSTLTFLENILVGIFVIWSLVMSGAYLLDLKKARVNIERVSSVRSVTA